MGGKRRNHKTLPLRKHTNTAAPGPYRLTLKSGRNKVQIQTLFKESCQFQESSPLYPPNTPSGSRTSAFDQPGVSTMDYLLGAAILLGVWSLEVLVFLFSYKKHSRA